MTETNTQLMVRETIHRFVVERIDWNVHIRNVEISAFCPVCGARRGEPTWYHFCEDGDWYTCHTWRNPCGHVDLYTDVLKEARDLEESKL